MARCRGKRRIFACIIATVCFGVAIWKTHDVRKLREGESSRRTVAKDEMSTHTQDFVAGMRGNEDETWTELPQDEAREMGRIADDLYRTLSEG